MLDSKWYPWNHCLINNVEDFVVFLGLNVFNSGNSYAFLLKTCSSNFCEETMYTKKTISHSLYPHSKFEFEQDLLSLYRPARWQRVLTRSYGTVRCPKELTYDRGQFSWHSPVRGLTMTTPMARSDFLQHPAPWIPTWLDMAFESTIVNRILRFIIKYVDLI